MRIDDRWDELIPGRVAVFVVVAVTPAVVLIDVVHNAVELEPPIKLNWIVWW